MMIPSSFCLIGMSRKRCIRSRYFSTDLATIISLELMVIRAFAAAL
jgi:hypothetical protein